MAIKTITKTASLITAVFFLSTSAFAQEDDGGPITQGDDAKYLSITHVSYRSGHREKAMEIINESFIPASEKSGVSGPIMVIHYQTGEWDAAYIWEMEGGMADLEWYRSPDDVKWFEALIEIAGGEEEANEIWKNYISTVHHSLTEVGHHHVTEE